MDRRHSLEIPALLIGEDALNIEMSLCARCFPFALLLGVLIHRSTRAARLNDCALSLPNTARL
jgi:hypothetical protein